MTSPTQIPVSARGRNLVLIAALLGWMFDGLEMGLFPLVARPALRDLLNGPSEVEITRWVSIITAMFLIGAATGGVVFGWLGDRIGRVRAMTLSVLTYALFSGLCGLARTAEEVAGLRFIASLGMGGEWSLGVALVMEVWPDRSRAWLAGVIGAAANFGYLIIAVVGMGLNRMIGPLREFLERCGLGEATTEWLVRSEGWRILMLFGVTPALLTLLIRLFVPESHRWKQEHAKGTTSHWRTVDLLGVLIGAAAATGMVAVWAYSDAPIWVRIAVSVALFPVILGGYLFPIFRFVRRAEVGDAATARSFRRRTLRMLITAAVLSGVALLGTWGSTQWAPTYAPILVDQQIKKELADHGLDVTKVDTKALRPDAYRNVKEHTQMCTAGGAVVGCVIAALVGGWIGRRITYSLLCVLSLAAVYSLFFLNGSFGTQFLVSAFVAGFLTAAFYGWLPLYLPELFPTRVRAIGQGFGFNFGRVLSAIGVLQLPIIRETYSVGWPEACVAMSLIYVLGAVIIWFAPETKGKPLPD